MKHQIIPRVIAKLFIPLILLFALYVQFHGDFGPGGGFQAGVIFAAGFVLYTLIFGLDEAKRVVRPGIVEMVIALGLLLYAVTGVAGILKGGRYLDYGVLGADPVGGQHLGILLIELGVGITVASVIIGVFFAFAGRARS